MQFVHTALTWGFLLALVPLLIHLINMMRHQRVRWAAMDFLLQSYKKHRKWIWLKQLLLLLMRMAAVVLLVAMLAQWVTRDQWLDLFGDRSVHHYVLLDDSFSMTDRSGAATAFDSARQVVSRIASRAADANQGQKLTLIRYSRAALGGALADAKTKLQQVADLNAEIIGSNIDVLLEEKRSLLEPTQLAVGPREATDLVRQLLETNSREKNVVYVVSDFRANQWENPAELRESLRQLEKAGAEIHLVNCVKAVQSNLAVTDIHASDDTRAAGVPLFVHVDVKNFGPSVAKKVQLKVSSTYFAPELVASGDVDQAQGDVEELPTILIDEIKAGETVSRRVQVFFPKPGQHVVEAWLPEDAVAADNRRWCVVDFPEGEPVLVIDGDPGQRNAYYLMSVFQPGQRANTGVRPTPQKPAYLRDASPQDLQAYRAIYLLDVDRLDDRAVENLEAFVRSGGGLAIFAGQQVNIARYNQQLYKDGAGLLPLPLEREDVLPPEIVENIADVEVTDHPVFQVFLGESNPFIRLVTVDKYFRPKADWNPPADSTVQIIARLRNRQPLVVERKFGEGRVVAFLTSLDPEWNNWAHDPSFIVVQLKLQSYLASSARRDDTHLVGTPLDVSVDAERFRPEIKFVSPGEKQGTRLVTDRMLQRSPEKKTVATAALGRGDSDSAADETARGGIYEAWPVTSDGVFQARRFAVNVDTSEGDLAVTESARLLTKLDPVKARFHQSGEYDWDLGDQPGINRSLLVMTLLIAFLLGEQLLSYAASYHPLRSPVPAATGVAR